MAKTSISARQCWIGGQRQETLSALVGRQSVDFLIKLHNLNQVRQYEGQQIRARICFSFLSLPQLLQVGQDLIQSLSSELNNQEYLLYSGNNKEKFFLRKNFIPPISFPILSIVQKWPQGVTMLLVPMIHIQIFSNFCNLRLELSWRLDFHNAGCLGPEKSLMAWCTRINSPDFCRNFPTCLDPEYQNAILRVLHRYWSGWTTWWPYHHAGTKQEAVYSLGDVSSMDLVVVGVLVFPIASLQRIQESHEVHCGDLEEEEKGHVAAGRTEDRNDPGLKEV